MWSVSRIALSMLSLRSMSLFQSLDHLSSLLCMTSEGSASKLPFSSNSSSNSNASPLLVHRWMAPAPPCNPSPTHSLKLLSDALLLLRWALMACAVALLLRVRS